MKLKIVFINGKDLIYISNQEDIERIKDSVDGTYKRNDNWIRVNGFYINLDNVAYIATMEDN